MGHSFLKHLSIFHLKNNIRDNICRGNNNILDCNKSFILEKITDNVSQPSISTPSTSSSTSCAISNNTSDMTVAEFAEKIEQASTLFVANLYSRPSLPRVFCQEMINLIKSFLNNVKIIEEKYKCIELNPHEDLNAMFNILNNAFADYSSEYQTMLYFKTLKSFIEPQEKCVDAFIDTKHMKTGKQMLVKNRKICIVSLEKILKTFLELPDLYIII